jgi:3-oxoacyl-[acyl-carrier protein] reductase
MSFAEQVVVITGGGSGIGEAVAHRVVEGGGTAVLLDSRSEALDRASSGLSDRGGQVCTAVVDVANASAVSETMGRLAAELRRLDVLVNCAGVTSTGRFFAISDEEYDRVMGVNVRGIWNCCRSVIPVMVEQKKGAIVNVSSVAALRGGGLYGTSVYAASKGAVISLTKALAREFAPDVRCNVVCPSLTMTEMGRAVVEEKGGMEHVLAMTPLARPAEPTEMAAAICFLGSEEASYVTGQVVAVDGGISM